MNIGFSFMPSETSIDITVLASRCEELGFESLWVPEHPVIPVHTTTQHSRLGGQVPRWMADQVDPFVALAMASGQFDIYDSSVREAVGGVLRSHGVQRTAGQSPMQLLQGLSPSQVTAIGSDVQEMLGESGGGGSAGPRSSWPRGKGRAPSVQGPIRRLVANPFGQAAPWARRAPGG